VTQSNASQTEEMSGTAVALSGQAEQLQAVVAQFNLNRDAQQTTKSTSYAPAKQPQAKSYAAPSKPAKRKSAPAKSASRRGEELELVGAGVGGDGFEEF
jgi:methyl-accepting chemotaxis protein